MRASLVTAGELVSFDVDVPWVARAIREGAAGELLEGSGDDVTVRVRVDGVKRPFDVIGWEPFARHGWRRDESLVLEDVGGSGFSLLLRVHAGIPEFTFRWVPGPRERAAAWLLRARTQLLVREMLMQYPALWWAATRGRVPLHASLLSVQGRSLLIAGPGGVGKSTLIVDQQRLGARITADNLVCTDGTWAWAVVEPLRVPGGIGRRTTHGRREVNLDDRLNTQRPDAVVVLQRDVTASGGSVELIPPGDAERSLVGGTYAAGELRRFWALTALLGVGLGAGPVHPPVQQTGARLCQRLPCLVLSVGSSPGLSLSALMPRVKELTW